MLQCTIKTKKNFFFLKNSTHLLISHVFFLRLIKEISLKMNESIIDRSINKKKEKTFDSTKMMKWHKNVVLTMQKIIELIIVFLFKNKMFFLFTKIWIDVIKCFKNCSSCQLNYDYESRFEIYDRIISQKSYRSDVKVEKCEKR